MLKKEILNAMYAALSGSGKIMCLHVRTPDHNEISAVVAPDTGTKGADFMVKNLSFYEVVLSEEEFRQKSAIPWNGLYNYYVMPDEVYLSVGKEIPKKIGVYVYYKSGFLKKKKKAKECSTSLSPTDLQVFIKNMMSSLDAENKTMKELSMSDIGKGVSAWRMMTEEDKTDFFIKMYPTFDFCNRCIYTKSKSKECKGCTHRSDDHFIPKKK